LCVGAVESTMFTHRRRQSKPARRRFRAFRIGDVT
jgi:hypothetical protein